MKNTFTEQALVFLEAVNVDEPVEQLASLLRETYLAGLKKGFAISTFDILSQNVADVLSNDRGIE